MNSNVKTANITLTRLTRLTLTLAMGLLLGPATLEAQQTLRDIAEEGGVTWLIGKWTGYSQRGSEVEVEYEWELDGHAVELELEMGQGGYKGLIFLNPEGGEEAIEVGGDSGGGMTRAVWREDYGQLISERVSTRPGGEIMRIAIISESTGPNTMKATVHRLSADGVISSEALDTVKFTRAKEEEDDD